MYFKVEFKTNLHAIIYQWASQSRFFSKKIPIEDRREKYLKALDELRNMFNRHHKEIKDAHFSRIYRFLRDFLDFEGNDEYDELNKRFEKFLYHELE